ncbi:helix-turn-helix domain-containing protein [Mycolicibacterium houstonense]
MQQSASYLNVTDRTCRRYVARGLLPARRVGPRLLRVRLSDLEAFAAA